MGRGKSMPSLRTLQYDRLHRCVVFVCGDAPIDDKEWDAYLGFVASRMKPGLQHRSLVLAKGSLTSLQRKKLAEVVAPVQATLKSAVVTESALVRGIVTALAWFSRDVFRIFAPSDLDRALEFLDLRGTQAREIRELSITLQERLAINATSAA
jgi:hypothetical protein